ncbi:MEKHLA domain-containing protein [Gallionella capsiferriformans]|uniref:MEKHLA domain protein n=1 Tax=Gallionella capsiferriformans (strain ES-2) TaxID=395494 RepID=D9SIV7_GALCS|nr:MEKHLA domain-containing protein [Gallionella capsiferriformans]ADL54233.1 MEKHLA domain protein [Gallionella capsiferriformans ES-2]
MTTDTPPDTALTDPRLPLILDSYQRLTGKILLADTQSMWHAPFAIVAHDTASDPVFFYGNKLALQQFEMSFEEFVKLPSRLSAEPLAQEARAKLLHKVSLQGYIDDYCGMRISGKNTRFMIRNATVWNLIDEAGLCHGQAATFITHK